MTEAEIANNLCSFNKYLVGHVLGNEEIKNSSTYGSFTFEKQKLSGRAVITILGNYKDHRLQRDNSGFLVTPAPFLYIRVGVGFLSIPN